MISRVPLFAELDAGEIADVMQLLRAHLAETGEVIVREGDHAHSMYFIAAGEVEVAVDKKKVKLGAGQFFGEVAVLRGERRSGTAVALSRTNLLALSAQDLHALMKRDSRIAKRIKDVVEKRTGKKVRSSKADPDKAK
jgi:voltage-gated potassium channel